MFLKKCRAIPAKNYARLQDDEISELGHTIKLASAGHLRNLRSHRQLERFIEFNRPCPATEHTATAKREWTKRTNMFRCFFLFFALLARS